ncbi:hypothetical protein EV127DRAFT_195456 [Xylaria flabelliformis]|nr:hypothetical protein EV127DRAFT_195456 [Xylaria flabelliformis]
MYRSPVPALVVAIIAGLPSWVNSQQSGWAPNQVNATMCAWKAFRAAQLKDTAYLDGGYLYWTPGLADGGLGVPTQDGNPLGLTYTLNFSIPFDSSTNVSSILKTISLTPNAGANNLKPNYYDGAMLANDHEFFLYGGLIKNTAAYTLPDADEVLYYRASDYGVPKPAFIPGFGNDKLPGNLTRYVTYGGAANAPSENKAWYFGGSRSPSWGPIYQIGNNNSFNPTNVSNTLITLDLSESQSDKWTNVTLPPEIPSRANPSAVWVPVGEQGILVVLGGVAYPQYSTSDQVSLNAAQSEKVSPGYMTNIDIYDVASGTWYQQPTTEAPPPSAMGCAVVATAQDFSSYNIYYYGGYDGLNPNENFRDNVWVLSLPSFTWTQLSSGSLTHARAGHQCLTPYPDQMVTIGGFRSPKGGGFLCLEGGILQVFNLTSGEWLDSYDPSKWNKYGVPEMVHKKIGGDYAGGATLAAPSPSWAATELASIFATKYETSKITTYYPYSSQSPDNGTRGDWDGGKQGGGGTPSWVAPVLGVVLGLVFLTAIAVGILVYRRRGLLRRKENSGTDSSGPDERHHFIRTWLNNHPEKAPTITTDDPSSRYDDMRSRNNTPMPSGGYAASSPTPEMSQLGVQHEMPENSRFELGDTSRAIELSGEALPFTDVIKRYTQLHSPNSRHSGSPHSVQKSPSFFTGSVSQDQPSSLSSSQAGINPATAAAAMARERPDSPPLGRASPMRTPPPNRDAVVSDLSRISEHHMSHLRNLSGATVSSNSAPSPPTTPPAMQTGFTAGPVSPPLPSPFDEREAGDYVSMYQHMGTTGQHGNSAQAGPSRGPRPSSSLRLSIFRENSEDLGDRPAQSHTQ